MLEVAGESNVIVMLLEELVLPLKKQHPLAFQTGITQLKTFGNFGVLQQEWVMLLDELSKG